MSCSLKNVSKYVDKFDVQKKLNLRVNRMPWPDWAQCSPIRTFAKLKFITGILFSCYFLSSSALAQGGPPAPPAGTGAGGGTGGAAAAPAGAGTAGTSLPGPRAPLDPNGLYNQYNAPNLPSGIMAPNPAVNPVINPIYGGAIYNYTPSTAPIASYLAACAAAMNPLMQNLSAIRKVRRELDIENDRQGFKPDPIFEKLDPEVRRRSADAIVSSFKPEAGCQKFMNKAGEVGPWGRTLLAELDLYKDVYESKIPKDAPQYCPAFPSMDPPRRKLFWLWFFASLSQPESSCRSHAQGDGPNGKALGLFQLEPPACARVGMTVTQSELLDPSTNIRCAVAVFAKEMKNRDTIMINHSRGPSGTYWGPLRNDDENVGRGGDIRAAQTARSLIKQYPDCIKN